MTSGIALIGGALAGSAAGSAAGAALQRWPDGDDLSSPRRSRCDACSRTLRARELVPVLSWLLQRGRCRSCGARIDARLPVLEAASAAVAAGSVHVHGGARGVALAVGAVAVLLATFTDLEHLRIPDRLTVPLAAFGLAGATLLSGGVGEVRTAVGWALGVPVLLVAVTLACRRGGLPDPIGGGDVKLLVGVLALASLVPGGPAAVLGLAILSAGWFAVFGLALGRITRGHRMPFAPSIAGGYLVVVLLPSIPSALVAAAIPGAGG